MSDVLIKAECVSKKFCRKLSRSMLYGIQDISKAAIGMPTDTGELRSGEFWAVDDLSFELDRGQCLGLIGKNGSGKSTLLKILNGIFSPDKGRVEIEGKVGALIEIGAGFHPMLSGRENVYVNGAILGFSKREIDAKFEDIVEFSELSEFLDTPVKHYSSGMRVRLGFAIAAQMEPDVLLIDEVLAVGDIGFRIKCINRIGELIQKSAVVFVTHTMPQVTSICSRVMILEKGTAAYHDSDVARGIDYYLANFSLPDEHVSGSGKAVVSDVRLSNGHRQVNGDEVLFLNYEADLAIEMTLTLDTSVNHPAIKIIVWNQELRPVLDCFSQHSGFEISVARSSKIELRLGGLQLNAGVYSVAIVVVDLANNEILSRNDYVARFQVQSTYASWASILARGEWTQKENVR